MYRKLICLIGLMAIFAWSANAPAAMVDNFESYSIGDVNTVAHPPWTELAREGNALAAKIAGSKYLTVKPADGNALLVDPTNIAYRGITSIPDTDTATTLFLRFRPETATTNSSFGLSILAVPTNYNTGSFNDLNVQMRVNNTLIGGVVTPVFNVRGAGGVPTAWTANYALTVGQWYNVWAVINQSTDRFDVYLTTGNNGADIVGNRLYTVLGNAFRVAAPTALVAFDAVSQGSNLTTNPNTLDLDDIYLTPGTNLFYLWASSPHPADVSTYNGTNVTLAWTPGHYAAKHDVYFGTVLNDVNDANRATPLGVLVSQNRDPNNYPVTATPGTTYYWRIDEVNDAHPDKLWKGGVWRFTAAPVTAYNPSPLDDAILVDPNAILSWSAGMYAASHKVYLDPSEAKVIARSGCQVNGVIRTEPNYTTPALESFKTYYWAIDEVNTPNTWPGPVWSFTTWRYISINADPNFVGWWKFEDDEGGAAFDWSGHNRHGTLHGGPNYATGIFGKAIDLDGINDWVSVGSVGAGTGGSAKRTIAGWAKMNTTTIPAWTNVFGFVSAGNTTEHTCFNIDVSGGYGSTAGWYIIHILNWQRDILKPDLEWHHFAATYDGSMVRWYGDGEFKGEEVPSGPILTTTNNVQMGKRTTNANHFPGLIDDVRIYNRVLTLEEIRQIMNPPQAWLPNPTNNDTEVDKNPTLTWKPGCYAAVTGGHELYFSSNFNDVNERKPAAYIDTLDNPSYTIPSPPAPLNDPNLVSPKTYYWAVDEVNPSTPPNFWKGNVWSFTVPIYKVVDNFEEYKATGIQNLENPGPLTPDNGSRLLRRTWIDGLWTMGWAGGPPPGHTTDATSGSYVQLNTDPCDGNLALAFSNKGNIAQGGTKSMKFYYDNDGTIDWVNDLKLPLSYTYESYGPDWDWDYDSSNYYSEASAAIDDAARISSDQNSLGMSKDWSGYKLLKISYYGDPCNTVVSTDKLYVTLTDRSASGHVATVTNLDQTYIKRSGWHNWYIPLSIGSGSFKAQNAALNLEDVNRIYIGIGNRASPATGGRGAVFFDNIQLYPVSVCIPGTLAGDFNGNCKVDANDLQRMTQLWLGQLPTVPEPNLVINLNASTLIQGDHTPVTSWSNTGSAGGSFKDFNSAISGHRPTLQTVESVKAVVFDGNDIMLATFRAPASITGRNPFTVIYKVWNLEIGDNERVFSWANRGTTARYAGVGYSANTVYGAVGHQGPNFDMGFQEPNGVPAAHTWHTIAVTYPGTSPGGPNTVETLMVDGVVSATEVKTLNIWPDCNMTIGAAYDGNSTAVPRAALTPIYFFSGALANLKVYNVAIPPKDLAMLMGTPIDMKKDADNRINFKDLALFANNWMVGPVLFP